MATIIIFTFSTLKKMRLTEVKCLAFNMLKTSYKARSKKLLISIILIFLQVSKLDHIVKWTLMHIKEAQCAVCDIFLPGRAYR